ncbi:hypothetical protein ACJD0Z_16855 [Flavobacteriaceae bacterium M23B6Z8]
MREKSATSAPEISAEQINKMRRQTTFKYNAVSNAIKKNNIKLEGSGSKDLSNWLYFN